jgi:class 3 adenylate cyclase
MAPLFFAEPLSGSVGHKEESMLERLDHYKQLIIFILTTGITLLHFIPLPGWPGTHLLHRELYFFPILLAGFWFGTIGGLIASMGVSIVYVFQFAISGVLYDIMEAIGFQVTVFIAVGLFMGWMVDRQERRREEYNIVNETFGRYVSPQVRDEILNGRIAMDGELKQVTVLFADLRNFTGLLENQDPRIVVQMINRYFKEMTEAIRRHGGLILQFVGDEIEAVFGAPVSTKRHAGMALQAAIEMRMRLEKLNKALIKEGLPTFHHGIGIHTGPVLAGNIGSPDRLSYAMVGSTVNLASRIQEVNKAMGTDILITAQTRALLDNHFNLVKLKQVKVKGFSKPVEIYRLDSAPIGGFPQKEQVQPVHLKDKCAIP